MRHFPFKCVRLDHILAALLHNGGADFDAACVTEGGEPSQIALYYLFTTLSRIKTVFCIRKRVWPDHIFSKKL